MRDATKLTLGFAYDDAYAEKSNRSYSSAAATMQTKTKISRTKPMVADIFSLFDVFIKSGEGGPGVLTADSVRRTSLWAEGAITPRATIAVTMARLAPMVMNSPKVVVGEKLLIFPPDITNASMTPKPTVDRANNSEYLTYFGKSFRTISPLVAGLNVGSKGPRTIPKTIAAPIQPTALKM